MKKGQITVFVIIGVVIVILIGAFLYNVNKRNKVQFEREIGDVSLELYAEQIQEYVEQCLYDELRNLLFHRLSLQGGYIDPESENIKWSRSGFIKIPYWFHNGEDISPELDYIEKQVSQHVQTNIDNCTDFSAMESLRKVSITVFDEINVNTTINNHSVLVQINYPVSLEIEDNKNTIESFNVNIKTPLGRNFNIAKQLLQQAIDSNVNIGEFNVAGVGNTTRTTSQINIVPVNKMIVLFDYSTFSDPKYDRTFVFQYKYDELNIYGYCIG